MNDAAREFAKVVVYPVIMGVAASATFLTLSPRSASQVELDTALKSLETEHNINIRLHEASRTDRRSLRDQVTANQKKIELLLSEIKRKQEVVVDPKARQAHP